MAEVKVQWIGWVRDMQAPRPLIWTMVPESGQATYLSCIAVLNQLFPDPLVDPKDPNKGQCLGECRWSKWAGKKGQKPDVWVE